MPNFFNIFQILGMAKQNPQQAVLSILEQGYRSGRINFQQYNLLSNQLQNGANPNLIIQQLMNSGVANQQMYENARQQAGMFR